MNITSFETGPFCVNTYFVPLENNNLMLVDPGGNPSKILDFIKKSNMELSIIVLTHGHFDHLIALPNVYSVYPNCEIAIHKNETKWLGKGAIERHLDFFKMLGAESVVRRNSSELPSCTQELDEGNHLLLPNGKSIKDWEVLLTPGHSPGSICLYNKDQNILISGDTLFNSGIGRTDGPGGSVDVMEKSLERLSLLPKNTRVLPGHGLETTINNEFF